MYKFNKEISTPLGIVIIIVALIVFCGGVFVYQRFTTPEKRAGNQQIKTEVSNKQYQPKNNNNSITSASLIESSDVAMKSFSYQGKTINPLCLDSFVFSEPDSTGNDLNSCNTGKIAETQEDGWLNADFSSDDSSQGFVSYRVFAKKDDNFLVAVRENGGGSGVFDGIMWVKINGSKLEFLKNEQLDGIGGDRCEGGIADCNFENGFLTISQDITAEDIANFFETDKDQKDYGLDGSAAGCFGTVNYKYDIANDKISTTSISLTGDGQDWEGEVKNQSCFNKIYKQYVAEKKIELSLDDLKIFIGKFLNECNISNK
jgi:hypothetical protein